MNIESILLEMADAAYKEFQSKLIPNIDSDKIIGVRIPELKAFAKSIRDTKEADEFLSSLPHKYYDENNLHAFLIAQTKNFDECIEKIDSFLPFVDNWATCDSLRPKCFRNNTDKLLVHIYRWINSNHTYTVRFGIEMLMLFYLSDKFDEKYLKTVASITSNEYYINMMIAWYFATALSKQYKAALPYLENANLSKWIQNKTIQKAVESYKINTEQKIYLKTLRRK